MKRVGEPRGKYNKKKMTDSHQSNIVRPALKWMRDQNTPLLI